MCHSDRLRSLSSLVVLTVGLLTSLSTEAGTTQPPRPSPISLALESASKDGSNVVARETPPVAATYDVHDVPYAVVDEDQTLLSDFLRGAANQREGGKYLEPVFLDREAALHQVMARSALRR